MSGSDRAVTTPDRSGAWETFRHLPYLSNHWAPSGTTLGYYWYLTFDNQPELLSLVERCQRGIAFPHYDLIKASGLHLTVDRIGDADRITDGDLRAIETAARHACQDMAPFTITIGALGGTPGAVGFSATPAEPIRRLRDLLRTATGSVCTGEATKDFLNYPHVAIAYGNTDGIPAADTIAAVEQLRAIPPVPVQISAATLVLLQRRQRAYAWRTIADIPLLR